MLAVLQNDQLGNNVTGGKPFYELGKNDLYFSFILLNSIPLSGIYSVVLGKSDGHLKNCLSDKYKSVEFWTPSLVKHYRT